MDMVRKLILDKLMESGLTMKEVSLRMGMSHSYLQQFLKRGVPAELGEHERAKLSTILGVPEKELRGMSAKLPAKEYVKPNDSEKSQIFGPHQVKNVADMNLTVPLRQLVGDSDLPVFALAQGGAMGTMIITSEPIDWESRPGFLMKVKDAYGIIVAGDSMAPEHKSGSTALVNPHLPPRAGDTCIFRSDDGNGGVRILIKELRRFTDKIWFVHQHNPPKDFQLSRSEWQVCHVTVGNYFR